MRRRHALKGIGALVGAPVAYRCGGDNPTTPTPFGEGLTVVSLDKRQPVLGALVTVGSDTATIAVPPGYLGPRITRQLKGTEALWPDTAYLPARFTFLALHGEKGLGVKRPTKSLLTVSLAQEDSDLPRVQEALAWGVQKVNAVYRSGQFQYVLVSPGDKSAQVQVALLPDDPIWSAKDLDPNAGVVTQCYPAASYVTQSVRITFRTYDAYWENHLERAMAHELAHGAGFTGHPGPVGGLEGLMLGSTHTVLDFSPQEKDVLNWLFEREPGTQWVDDSSGLVKASTTVEPGHTPGLVCSLAIP